MTADRIARRVVVSGDVQGVFFRDSHAPRGERGSASTGWVRNRPDGRVEAWFEGPPDAVARLVRWCERRPASRDRRGRAGQRSRARGPRPLRDPLTDVAASLGAMALHERDYEVGVRDLHDRLSEHLDRVVLGAEVVVTRRGRPIARLSAIDAGLTRLTISFGAGS